MLLKLVKEGDTIVFDSVSRMSGNADEGFNAYEELYNRGVSLVFLKEPHINTDTYKQALESNIKLTGAVTGNVSFTGAGGDVTINTTVNHTHSYLPLSGGTLSGPLNFSNNSSISWNQGTYQ